MTTANVFQSHLPRTVRATLFLLLATLLGSCAWYPPRLDREVRSLKEEIDTRRATLEAEAKPYFVDPSRDFRLEVSAQPISDTMDTFSGLSPSKKLMSMESSSHHGYLAEAWTDCPWGIPGRIGAYVEPLHFKALFKLNSMHGSWDTNGLSFRLSGSSGLAVMIVDGGLEFCWHVRAPVSPGGAAIAFYAPNADGFGKFSPTNDGLAYELALRDNLYGVATVVFPGFDFTIPVWDKPSLLKGTLRNIMGKEGKVKITQVGQERRYKVDVRFNRVDYLAHGPAAAGDIQVTWLP